MGLAEGDWWIRSESDPRWDCNGTGLVGMFMTIESCGPARQIFEAKKEALGEPPADLKFGYMKA